MLLIFFVSGKDVSILRSFVAIMAVISLIYHLTMYTQFFQQRTFAGFCKAFAAYLLGFALFFVTIMIVSFLVGFIYVKFIRGH